MGVKKRPVSPRQKMINLLYVVLMAMLALNVSTDVLNGFSIINQSIGRTAINAAQDNQLIFDNLMQQMKQNPTKVQKWYNLAKGVKLQADTLYQYLSVLKHRIAVAADGKGAREETLRNKGDKEASNSVMLSATDGQGLRLRQQIDFFRKTVVQNISDIKQRELVYSNLSTDIPKEGIVQGKKWEEYFFEEMPASAAIAILTKLQNDVRYAEGEALRNLVANVDIRDIRVNALTAFVIPNAQTVVQGGKFKAQIVMAAIDTTQRPEIFIGGRRMTASDGVYETTTNAIGDFMLQGYITLRNGEGELVRRDFKQPYTVVAPSATVSADLMNVLYAGYSNPISMSVPGIPINQIVATMQGGTLQAIGLGKYIAHPTKVGGSATITVMASIDGRTQEMGKYTFKVRRLPDPTAYIPFVDAKGSEVHYRGGGQRLTKGFLLSAEGIGAAIDDGLLNIPFRVISFETVFFDNMGNAVPESSSGPQFSERQKNIFRRLASGKRFYVSRIKVVGPDGVERNLSQALDVIVQ